MKIGIDASRAFVENPTGTERYAYEIITRMLNLEQARDHEWVLYVKPNFQSIFNNSKFKFQIIPLPYLWTQAGLAARTWIDRLDVLWIPAHTLPVLRKPGVRTVVTVHGIEYEWLPAYESWLQRWYLPWSTIYAVSRATKVIAVSEFTRQQLIERLGAEERKISVIHEGYDIQATNHKSQILNKYKLQPKKYLLFVGTLQPRKNLDRLIEAFAGLGNGELKLVIAGKPGWNYQPVYRAADRWGVQNKVIFTGYVDDESRGLLLEHALAYVQPSITEGFGLPVLEAMAAGIPVACSSGGALSEVAGKAAIMFDPMNVDQIKDSMKLIIGDSRLRRNLESKGRKRVKQFGWDTAAEKTLDLIVHDP